MKIKQYLPLLILISLFILTLLVNLQIGLFGDDYFYASFTKKEFWNMHKMHYLEINGRAIVHFLDSIFLALPKIFWQLLNSFMLTGIAYYGSKIVCSTKVNHANHNNIFIKSLITFFFGILMLNIWVIRQSVYWTTGSFNYIYPIFMLFWYWHVLQKNIKNNFKGNKLFLTSILAFFASATVEQGGMMSFGLTFLIFLYVLINNKIFKKDSTYKDIKLTNIFIILFCSFIGVASVVLTPSQFIRFELETDENFNLITSIKNCINFLIETFILKDFYRPHILLAILSVLLTFIPFKKTSKFNSEQFFLLITSFILGFGSQIMIIVSPVYGERNTLFGIFMIILFTTVLISNLPKTNKKVFKFIENSFYCFLIICGILNILNIYKNYKITNQIQNENIQLIKNYKNSRAVTNEQLTLYKIIDDKYSWSMPYYSIYHENWFKIYYEIEDSNISWIDYNILK